jgi:4-alpha-glucanotransferase
MVWREHGIQTSYQDGSGTWHQASRTGLDAALEAMRSGEGAGDRSADAVWVLRQGETHPVDGPSELRLENGSTIGVEAFLPRDLPLGYHDLVPRDGGQSIRVIVSPGTCFLPGNLFTWGWAVQLYALRSQASWGIGDLADLRELGRWSAQDLGAGMLLVNPLHAPLPTPSQQPSPYYPSSRIFRNPLYLAIRNVPGAAQMGADLAPLANEGIGLLTGERIDRDAVFSVKMAALQKLWSRFGGDDGFDQYCLTEGDLLDAYATFCVLTEKHSGPWQQWPSEYRRPDSAEVAAFRGANIDRVRFHKWLQWLLDEQLREAASEIPIVGDLAVGVDPSGADAWLWHDIFAHGIEVGAPPDEFNTQGQKWGLVPFVPSRLRAARYEPFVRIVRSAMRHCKGMRLDHVMALFRLFWIAPGLGPSDGVYVRYQALDLLDIVALESHRAHAYVIGEDLGTVQKDVRRELSFRQILSYRVMWFEKGPTADYPEHAVATVTTHDLPTIAGLWSGSDLRLQEQAGLSPNVEGTHALRADLRKRTGVREDAPADEVVLATHAALAQAPSVLLTATLEDALSVQARPNMPGTTIEYPCWCIPLPQTLEQIEQDPRPRQIGAALGSRRKLNQQA